MGAKLLLINQNFSVDTAANAIVKIPARDSVTAVKGSLLHTGSRLYEAHHSFIGTNPVLSADQYWIFYVLFGVIAFFAVIRYYIPQDLKGLTSPFRKNPMGPEVENNGKMGFVVTLFLFVNYLINIGLLVVAINLKYHPIDFYNIPAFYLFLITAGVVLGYYLFNKIAILVIGFIFGTSKQALWHAKTGSLLAFILGIFLLPLLLFYFFTGFDLLLYLSVFLAILAILIKWIFLLRNSYSENHFTLFHNILYLCALEIIPIMLLIKLGMIWA